MTCATLPSDLRKRKDALPRRAEPELVPMTDSELSAALYHPRKKRFVAACEELNNVYRPRLAYYLAYLFNGGRVDEFIDDLVEDTFLNVIRTRTSGKGRFDPSRGVAFRTWLFRIGRNLSHDRWSRRRHEPALVGDILEDMGATTPPEEIELAPEDLVDGPLRACLLELPLGLREMIALDLLGYSLQEICYILGIEKPPRKKRLHLPKEVKEICKGLDIETYGTAGSRLHTARTRMREGLSARGYRFAPYHVDLPPGTRIVMRFPDERLVQLDPSVFTPAGYRIVQQLTELGRGDRVILVFPVEQEVLVKRADAAREEM